MDFEEGFKQAGAYEKQVILREGIKVTKDIFVGKFETIGKLLINDEVADLYNSAYVSTSAFNKEVNMRIAKLEHKKLNNQIKQKIFEAIQKIEEGQEDEEEEEKEEFQVVSKLEADNKLYEVVNDGKNSFFAWLEDGQAKYSGDLLIDGIKYLPANNTTVKEKAVVLPKAAKEYESEEKLLEELQAFMHKYLDISEDYEIFACYYILLSWVYDRLTTVPYLRVLGDFSTGKSRFLDVVGKLCYKPIVMAGTVTPAPLYRLQSFWKGTILIDEGDRKKSDEADEITKILNCGFEKNKPVIRCEKNNPNDIEVHDVFGAKVIATRFPFYDLALESRCLTEHMTETERKDIPTILPPQFFEEQEELRQKLLMFRLKERANIDANHIQKIDLGAIEKRLKQALSSFAVLFANKPALLEKFKAFVLEYQQELIRERETSLDGLIVNYLLEMNDKSLTEEITSGDITEHLKSEQNMQNIAPATVGKHLKALGVETKPKKIEGKTKRVIEWNSGLMDKLFQKYNADYWLDSRNNRNSRNRCNQQKTLAEVAGVSEVTEDTETKDELVVERNYIE